MNPNAYPSFSHRSQTFKDLFRQTTRQLLDLAGLDAERDCALLITGSGTLANEIVISSLRQRPTIVTEGAFSARLVATTKHHHGDSESTDITMGVYYETAESLFTGVEATVVDCVSSFPYYGLPKTSRIMTTVSSKQLSAHCGISIIFIRDYKNVGDLIKDAAPSYLSLARYIEAYDRDQTPNTPAITAIEDLNDVLCTYDAVMESRKIMEMRKTLVAACEDAGIEIMGTGPVLTFADPVNPVPQIELYMNSGRPQCFLWATNDADFETLLFALEAESKV